MAHEKNHDYHILPPSTWPLLSSIAGCVMLVGGVFWMLGGGWWMVGSGWLMVSDIPMNPNLGFVLLIWGFYKMCMCVACSAIYKACQLS